MQTKEAIQFALTLSDKATMNLLDQISDNPTRFPTTNGGCHPLWVLGHLTLIESFLPGILFGEPSPVAGWQKLFGEHSEPVDDASAYPPFAEIRKKYQELRERNLDILSSLTESDLDKATVAPPPGREKEFATFGSSFLTLALHQALHRSHVTDAMRSAGRMAPALQAAS
jgi:DinB family protein